HINVFQLCLSLAAITNAAAILPQVRAVAGHPPKILLTRTFADDHRISNILSRATRAQRFTLSLTLIWLTMLPSTRFSSAQHRCCGDIRNMVVQRHPESSSVLTCLSGFSLARRFTRWISVPMANEVPAGASSTTLMRWSVEPISSAFRQTSQRHSG